VLDARQDVAQTLGAAVLKLPRELVQDRSLHPAQPCDREDRIHMRTQAQGVAKRQQRRRVDEHEIRPLCEFIKDVKETLVVQRLTDRGRNRPRRQKLKTPFRRASVCRCGLSIHAQLAG
jgi:hypothetical protein